MVVPCLFESVPFLYLDLFPRHPWILLDLYLISSPAIFAASPLISNAESQAPSLPSYLANQGLPVEKPSD